MIFKKQNYEVECKGYFDDECDLVSYEIKIFFETFNDTFIYDIALNLDDYKVGIYSLVNHKDNELRKDLAREVFGLLEFELIEVMKFMYKLM